MCMIVTCYFQEELHYTSREEQGQLLQQVLAASDMDADEEKMPGEGTRGAGPSVSKSNVILYS
jgi:DNA excision repair protein ERCC-3